MDETALPDDKRARLAVYRYWQSRPVHERMAEVTRLSLAAYGLEEADRPSLRECPWVVLPWPPPAES